MPWVTYKSDYPTLFPCAREEEFVFEKHCRTPGEKEQEIVCQGCHEGNDPFQIIFLFLSKLKQNPKRDPGKKEFDVVMISLGLIFCYLNLYFLDDPCVLISSLF